MTDANASPVVVARGDLGRMRELARYLAEAGIGSELISPGPRSRHA